MNKTIKIKDFDINFFLRKSFRGKKFTGKLYFIPTLLFERYKSNLPDLDITYFGLSLQVLFLELGLSYMKKVLK